MTRSFLLILIASISFSAMAQGIDFNDPAIDRKFIREFVVGEYIDTFNGKRFWISETEAHMVDFQPIQKTNEPAKSLMMQQLINAVLTLQPKTDEMSVRGLSNKLRESGIRANCTSAKAHFVAANAGSRSAILRYPNVIDDQVLDMQILLSDRWTATYIGLRSKQLAKAGVLPFLDAKESELGRNAPLGDLPFTAPRLAHKVSGMTIPSIDWCSK